MCDRCGGKLERIQADAVMIRARCMTCGKRYQIPVVQKRGAVWRDGGWRRCVEAAGVIEGKGE